MNSDFQYAVYRSETGTVRLLHLKRVPEHEFLFYFSQKICDSLLQWDPALAPQTFPLLFAFALI